MEGKRKKSTIDCVTGNKGKKIPAKVLRYLFPFEATLTVDVYVF